jgi:hypothetical protein
MQLFGGSFNFPTETPLSNFDTVLNALLTVFQVGRPGTDVMIFAEKFSEKLGVFEKMQG